MQVGRYELVGKLGEGGTAEVYLARVRGAARVQKLMVVKVLRPERAADAEARARFAEEARVAVSLSHPHIVPVFEFGESDGQLYLVMEWVRGGPLGAVAGKGRPPLTWQAAALVGSEICDALGAVHSRRDRSGAGLVHGDVTPANILLTNEGHALLGDFGMARFAARGRGGTERYLAPEQARGERFDGRADLYALALVLLEAVTAQAADQGIPSLAGVSPNLGEVLGRALAPAPAGRFADAAEMSRALERLLDGESGARARGRQDLADRLRLIRPAQERLIPPATATATADTAGATVLASAPSSSRRWLALAAATVAVLGATSWWARHTAPQQSPTTTQASGTTPRAATAAPQAPDNTTRTTSAAPQAPDTMTRTTSADAPHVPASGLRALARPSSNGPQRPPAERPRPRETAHVDAKAELSARLDLNAVPWATVFIDGAPAGETPLIDFALKPGSHTVELDNAALGIKRTITIVLAPGEHGRRIANLVP